MADRARLSFRGRKRVITGCGARAAHADSHVWGAEEATSAGVFHRGQSLPSSDPGDLRSHPLPHLEGQNQQCGAPFHAAHPQRCAEGASGVGGCTRASPRTAPAPSAPVWWSLGRVPHRRPCADCGEHWGSRGEWWAHGTLLLPPSGAPGGPVVGARLRLGTRRQCSLPPSHLALGLRLSPFCPLRPRGASGPWGFGGLALDDMRHVALRSRSV